jgi:hypothetical protein
MKREHVLDAPGITVMDAGMPVLNRNWNRSFFVLPARSAARRCASIPP